MKSSWKLAAWYFCLALFLLTFLFFDQNLPVDAVSDPDAPNPEVYDAVIVGGGISGCYCAWRLMQGDKPEEERDKMKPSVHLYESTDRIGGRLYSVTLPGMPHLLAELGGEYFLENQFITYGLAEKLKLPLEKRIEDFSDNLVFIRGKHLRESELSNSRLLPYSLKEHEEGRTPKGLILYALEKLIPDFSEMTEHDWQEKKGTFTFHEKSLEETSWQNYLAATLSAEAYQFLVDTSTIQLLNNVSLASQIPTFLKKSSLTEYRIATGFQEIPEKLAKEFEKLEGQIHKNHLLKEIYREDAPDGPVFRLVFEYQADDDHEVHVFARNVILALPKRALDQLNKKSFFFEDEETVENLGSVTPRPLMKLFLGYSSPWWRALALETGASFSDFELRKTYYFGMEEEAIDGEVGNHNALLLASYEGERLPFWQAFTIGTPFTGRGNPHISIGKSSMLKNLPISNDAITQTQRMLQILHDVKEISEPYTAAYYDWSNDPYGGAYYLWKIGADEKKISRKMLKPFSELKFYICCCAFSPQQAWVEGSLMNAETILEDYFGLKRAAWIPEDYKLVH